MKFILLFFTVLLMSVTVNAEPVRLKTVGWVEFVTIKDVDVQLKAKLDTGAKTSSIDAEILDIKKLKKRPEGYTSDKVVFSLTDDDGVKKKVFERNIVRYVRIKNKTGGYVRRPVVEMTYCIAGREAKEEVNLANREDFIYPVLVGRNMMTHAKLVVDASRTLITRPLCK